MFHIVHKIVAKSFFILTAFILLSGCANVFIEPYGFVAPDAEHAQKEVKSVFIAENVPSIPQGYKPPPPGVHITEASGVHNGFDVSAETGTPVIAVASGTVISSRYEPLFGNRVILEHHNDKIGPIFRSGYFHLSNRLVAEGEIVRRGQQIGELGSAGILASYPHLHFELRRALAKSPSEFEVVHPHLFWTDGPGRITCFDRDRQWPDFPFLMTYPVPCRGVEWK